MTMAISVLFRDAISVKVAITLNCHRNMTVTEIGVLKSPRCAYMRRSDPYEACDPDPTAPAMAAFHWNDGLDLDGFDGLAGRACVRACGLDANSAGYGAVCLARVFRQGPAEDQFRDGSGDAVAGAAP